jgi:hypothetical protein
MYLKILFLRIFGILSEKARYEIILYSEYEIRGGFAIQNWSNNFVRDKNHKNFNNNKIPDSSGAVYLFFLRSLSTLEMPAFTIFRKNNFTKWEFILINYANCEFVVISLP